MPLPDAHVQCARLLVEADAEPEAVRHVELRLKLSVLLAAHIHAWGKPGLRYDSVLVAVVDDCSAVCVVWDAYNPVAALVKHLAGLLVRKAPCAGNAAAEATVSEQGLLLLF